MDVKSLKDPLVFQLLIPIQNFYKKEIILEKKGNNFLYYKKDVK